MVAPTLLPFFLQVHISQQDTVWTSTFFPSVPSFIYFSFFFFSRWLHTHIYIYICIYIYLTLLKLFVVPHSFFFPMAFVYIDLFLKVLPQVYYCFLIFHIYSASAALFFFLAPAAKTKKRFLIIVSYCLFFFFLIPFCSQ